MARSIAGYFADEGKRENLQKLLDQGIAPVYDKKKTGLLSGRNVVFTGSLSRYTRSEIQALAPTSKALWARGPIYWWPGNGPAAS